VTAVRVDVRVPVGAPLPQLVDFAQRCEDAGLHGIGVHDHHHTGRDVYVVLAAAAQRTSRLALYPATSNTVVRSPLLLAALANSLSELAPGRGMLTLAPGFLSVEKAGLASGRREQVRQAVTAVRELLNLGRTVVDGTPLELFARPEQPVEAAAGLGPEAARARRGGR